MGEPASALAGKNAEIVLETAALTKTFGGLTAVDALDLRVHRGEISSLIGPNGAGKTTVFNVVTGHLPARARDGALPGTQHHRPEAAQDR